jgi:hypothetical protein
MSVQGSWKLELTTPMGVQTPTVTFSADGDKLSGTWTGPRGTAEFSDGTIDGNNVSWAVNVEAMGMKIAMECAAAIDGDQIAGEVKTPRGTINFSGQRA